MISEKVKEFHLDLDIGNARVIITMSGGFFDLPGITSSVGYVHSHNNYEFHLVIDGSAKLDTESGKYILNSDEAALIPPGVVHKGIESKNRIIKTALSFSYRKIQRKDANDIYSLLDNAFSRLSSAVKLECAKKYSIYLEDIFIALYSNSGYGEERLKALFLLLITELAHDLAPMEESSGIADTNVYSGRDSYNVMGAMMEEYVTRYFQKQITVSDLAEVIHLSEKQTARIFAKNFNMTFKQYVKHLRLNSARFLLASSDLPLEKVASEAGYLSYNGFYKLFRQQTGMTPIEYRRKKKTENKGELL